MFDVAKSPDDSRVPIEPIQKMAAAFEKVKGVHKLLTIEGAGQAFNAQHTAIIAPAMID
ncbi:hypothetical protein [Anatilimnocola aggregata]|nr:hypothetical protein [Anatilimnocola aggregata]